MSPGLDLGALCINSCFHTADVGPHCLIPIWLMILIKKVSVGAWNNSTASRVFALYAADWGLILRLLYGPLSPLRSNS